MTRTARSRLLVTVAIGALCLTGCSGEDEPAAVITPTIPVIQPGGPGEPNTLRTGDDVAPAPSPALDLDDVAFMQDMIVHHAQAIAMVAIAEPHLEDAQVKSLASRISDEQKPEIAAMEGWLSTRDLEVPPQATNPLLSDHSSHHASMKGMATEAQLTELAQARGAESERLWLTLMIAHHEGALAMVDEQHRDGIDETVTLLGDEIAVTQNVQIGYMREMLDRLS